MTKKTYTWKKGDDFARIAYKLSKGHEHGDPECFINLLDANLEVLKRNNYIMREGDVIIIPAEWSDQVI